MTKKLTYQTQGTCSKAIELELDDEGRIAMGHFIGGCAGNTTGISQLVRGMKPADVIDRLDNVRCGMKPTSCPHQLCQALRQIMAQ